VDLHLPIDDGEDLRHRPARSAKGTDDLEVEAALTLFPKEGEIRRAENPIFAGHFASTKARKTRFVIVYLVRLDKRAGQSQEMLKKSGHEAAEKVARMIVEV